MVQVFEQAWACLLQAHQHGNVRPHCQLFLVALLCHFPAGVESRLLPALSDFSAATSYQVQHWRLCTLRSLLWPTEHPTSVQHMHELCSIAHVYE